MKLFNWWRGQKPDPAKAMQSAPTWSHSLVVREPFTGAWQKGITVKRDTVLAYHALFACISLIAGDVSKMPAVVTEKGANGIWETKENTQLSHLLRNPRASTSFTLIDPDSVEVMPLAVSRADDFITLLSGKVYGFLSPEEDQQLEDLTVKALGILREEAAE